MTHTLTLAAAGFIVTAVSFGPARMGFGLFLPTFQENFELSTTMAGFIASLAFLAFLVALPLAAFMDHRYGQRMPVLLGCISAAIGFLCVAFADTLTLLAFGIALAGMSAGLCWSPFNDAAERVVPSDIRPSALSAVSTGTALGVAATGLFFLSVSYEYIDWRRAWIVFAGISVLAALMASIGLPKGRGKNPESTDGPARLLHVSAIPLYIAALCFGASNAVYISFAADHVATMGGLPGLTDRAAPAIIFIGYGIFGLMGLGTGRMENFFGLYALLGIIFAAFASSLFLVAFWPLSWPAVLLSAGLHGAAVMMISAVLSFWSLRLYPGQGSLGFTIALIAVAISSVLAPIIAGMIADYIDLKTAFLVMVIIPSFAMLFFLRRLLSLTF